MQFLIDRGIDMTIRDFRWNATAEGWAAFAANDEQLAQWLRDARQQRERGRPRNRVAVYSPSRHSGVPVLPMGRLDIAGYPACIAFLREVLPPAHCPFAPSRMGSVSRSLRDFTMPCVATLYFLKCGVSKCAW